LAQHQQLVGLAEQLVHLALQLLAWPLLVLLLHLVVLHLCQMVQYQQYPPSVLARQLL